MTPIKTTPKDFFLHLAATVFLYAVIISLVNLVLSLINYTFPDVLAGSYYANLSAWPISMLIVLTPVLYLVGWFIRKDIIQVPEKSGLWVRRWRIDLTIFLAAIVLIGDLVALINTYINGEITERFVFKFLAFLIIFGITFAYYLLERMNTHLAARKAFAWTGVILILAAIVWGFTVVGSPTKQREIKLDNQRVSDLQTIQWQIVSYWQLKQKLPTTLDDLWDPISNYHIPTDPETKTDYTYTAKGDKSFELCATFVRAVGDVTGGLGYGEKPIPVGPGVYDIGTGIDENWKHDAGRTCFTRTIDPERYPPYKPVKL